MTTQEIRKQRIQELVDVFDNSPDSKSKFAQSLLYDLIERGTKAATEHKTPMVYKAIEKIADREILTGIERDVKGYKLPEFCADVILDVLEQCKNPDLRSDHFRHKAMRDSWYGNRRNKETPSR